MLQQTEISRLISFVHPPRLGDRHGENILLDTTNGDVVHVDFNCLFGMVSMTSSLSEDLLTSMFAGVCLL